MDPATVSAVLIVSSVLYYAAVQTGLIIGLVRLRKPTSDAKPFVSVIVAARNEERSIARLLDSLLHQTYSNFEIVIVNDRSTDITAEVVRSYEESDPRIHLVTIESVFGGMPPKKNALTAGIRAAKGEILCFTDADCVPARTWIETVVSYFDVGVGVVAGYSPYDPNLLSTSAPGKRSNTLLNTFVVGEEFKGAVWSAGAIGMNLAWLCTGRNLAYRRSVFEQVGGFERIKMSVSGDDDLFLQLVRRQTQWNIRYATSPESVVRTAPPGSFAEFVTQRTRHFSAGKYFTLPMKAFFFFFHASNLILFVGLFASVLSTALAPLAITAFIAKLALDLIVALIATRVLIQRHPLRRFNFFTFLFTEILYIFYNTFIGPLGFFRRIEWKHDKTA